VFAEYVHVARQDNGVGDLVERSREHRLEIPGIIGIMKIGRRIAFNRPVPTDGIVDAQKRILEVERLHHCHFAREGADDAPTSIVRRC